MEAQKADPSAFYTRITHIFIKKYGFDLPFDQDVEGGAIPEDNEGNIVDAPEISEEEVERRRQIVKDLRPVSILLFLGFTLEFLPFSQKLAQWFRHKYTAKKSDKSAIADFLKSLSDVPARPRRQNPINLYSSLYYKGGPMQFEFQEIWNDAKATVPNSERLSMCRDFITRKWNEESEEFRANIAAQAEASYQEALSAFKSHGKAHHESSAEEYHRYILYS